jgi:hypothetical protein
MTLDEQKAAVFAVALRIKRETSEWRPAELRAIYKAMMEYPAGPYDAGPTPHALWTIQSRLVEDFEHVFFMRERIAQSDEAAQSELATKVSALRKNCVLVMQTIEETRDTAMLFMLQIKGLAVTLKPTAPVPSAA